MLLINDCVRVCGCARAGSVAAVVDVELAVRLTAALVGGLLLDGYTLGIIDPATGLIHDDLHVNDLWIGLIAAGMLFGIFVGAPSVGG